MNLSKWDEVEQQVKEKDAANSVWLKLPKSGDKAVVVFAGEPYLRESCFHDNKMVPLEEARKRKLKIRTTVALNVILWPSKEVKVLEKSTTFFKDVRILIKKYGLNRWAFEVTRYGDGLDTEHKILPEVELTPEDVRVIAKLELHDLAKLYAGEGGDAKSASDPAITEEEFPYGANVAQ